MKFLKILFVLLFISHLSFSQSVISLMNRADQFFETMNQGKFEEARDFMDESVKSQISLDELKLFWLRLENSLGTYQSVDGAKSSIQGDYYQVILTCGFSRGSQPFTFVFNKDEKLVGFFISQKPVENEYALPSYADTSLYKEQEVKIKFAEGEMAGIFTSPKNLSNFPIVIMVHGSGPADMDETVGSNKPFKDLAAGLAAQGIASIRYVKRSMIYPNTFNKAFTVKEEVLDDALTAITLAGTLPGVNKAQIYVFGHSLGGMLAPRIASLAPSLKGIILAAAPARKFADLVTEQNEYLYKASGDTSAAGKQQFLESVIDIDKTRLLKLGDMAPDSVILGAPASYWLDLNNHDQLATAKKLKNRILVVQGEKDFQVSVRDFEIWKSGLTGNKNAMFKLYPDLNHLLSVQEEKGNGTQYRLPANVDINLIKDIAAWIKETN
jgi:dienelactone hydrolase